MNNYIDIHCDVSTQSFNSEDLYAHVFDYYLSPVDKEVYSSSHHLLIKLIHFNSFDATQLKTKEYCIGLLKDKVNIHDNTEHINGDGLEIVAICDENNKRFRFYVKGVNKVTSPVKIQILYATNQSNIEFNHNTYFDTDLSDMTVFKANNIFVKQEYTKYTLEPINGWEYENTGRNRIYTLNGMVYVDFSLKNIGGNNTRPFNLPIKCKTSKQFPIAYYSGGVWKTASMRIDGNGNPTLFGIKETLGESDYVIGNFSYPIQ